MRLLGWLGAGLVLAWGCFGLAWCGFWCGCGLCRDSVPTFLRVLALLGLCGGNCYHRRCLAACRRRVGGLWSQNPPWLLGRASIACPFGGCVGRVRHVFVCLSGWCGLFLLVAWGNCYHRRCVAACRRRVGGLWSQNPPSACSKCSPPWWYAGDMGCLGCSGLRFGRAGSWRGVFCGAACRVRRASVRAAGMIEPTVGAFCGAEREGAHLGVCWSRISVLRQGRCCRVWSGFSAAG